MTKEEALFIEIGSSIKKAEQSQMFGKPCFKTDGKAFVCFFQNAMVFKLTGSMHKEALSLGGSLLFDPSAKGRPMKEWVQVPPDHKKHWEGFAKSALEYVRSLAKA